jgi:hypothetical protein
MRRRLGDETALVLDDPTESIAHVLRLAGEHDGRNQMIVWNHDDVTAMSIVNGDVVVDEAVWQQGSIARVVTATIDEKEDGGFGGGQRWGDRVIYVKLGGFGGR